MTPATPRVWARRHPVAAAAVAGAATVHLTWATGVAAAPAMTVTHCLLTAIALIVGGSLAGVVGRSAWLSLAAARGVAVLPRVVPPDALQAAARRAGLRGVVRCVTASDCTAFCAGLFRPRVYVTTAAVGTLSVGAMDAVLAHEAEHARRRDPLRRLVARAVADTCFYIPLIHWWSRHRTVQEELNADRAAIESVGRPAVAGALLAMSSGSSGPKAAAATVVGATGYADAGALRIAQLLGDPLPVRRPSGRRTLASLVGLCAAVALAACLGDAAAAELAWLAR